MTYEVSEGCDPCIASPRIFGYCKMTATPQLQKIKPTYVILVIVNYILTDFMAIASPQFPNCLLSSGLW